MSAPEEQPKTKPRPGMPPKASSQASSNKSAKQLARQRPSKLSMEGYIFNANAALEDALNPKTLSVPTEYLEKCKGIAILNIFNVGLLLGMHYGTGVIMAKRPSEASTDDSNKEKSLQWSAPSAVLVNGFSMGALVGAKNDSVMIFIMDDETMQDFAERPQSRIGLDVSLAVGKVGGAKNVGMDQGAVSLTLTRGIFAGLSLQLGTLVHQEKQNEHFYNKKMPPKSILLEDSVQAPASSQVPDLYKKLDQLYMGLTWVPTAEDLERSSRFLEASEHASKRFIQATEST